MIAEFSSAGHETGVDTHHLETWQQFEPSMIEGKQTTGASTAEFVIQQFVKNLEEA